MRRLTNALRVALVALLAALVLATPAFADEPYTYKVRVLAGKEGTVNGKNIDEVSGIAAGTEITLSTLFNAQATNETYYVKGFRVSGQDNLDGLKDNVVVNEDMDFVVSYGVRGDMVSYTLNFVEQGSGNVLANPITCYGKKGDKPVAAYEYVEGYRPLYRNITGTLGEDGTNNWTFEYVRLATGETVTTTTVTTVGGGTAAAVAPAAGTATAGTAAGGATAGGAAAGGTEGTEGTTGTGTTATENPPATQEILDVDNPLAAPGTGTGTGTSTGTGSGTGTTGRGGLRGMLVPILVILLVALMMFILFMLFAKRNAKQDEEQKDGSEKPSE